MIDIDVLELEHENQNMRNIIFQDIIPLLDETIQMLPSDTEGGIMVKKIKKTIETLLTV